MRTFVFEDGGAVNLQPLTLSRPAFDLRCGARTLLERQLRLVGEEGAALLVRPEMADPCRSAHPGLAVNYPTDFGGETVMLVNGRWLPPAGETPATRTPGVGVVGEQVAYVVLPPGEAAELSAERLEHRLAEWKQTLPNRPAGGRMIDYPWDLVEHNGETLEQDYQDWREAGVGSPADVAVVGPRERLLVDPSARIEPLVVIDTTRGPVLIDREAVVQSFSRLEGPCYVGPGTHVLSARVRNSSFGPHCRMGGEIECTVVQGYSNKAHDGFLGHSYLGEWVNLGAGTTVSDLRTDYGPISVLIAGRKVNSGLIKVGAYLGDHTKTSVNTLLNQGTVAGPFSLLLTSGTLMPRVLPPFCQFAHGRIQERADLRLMFATAATVMGRRGHRWTDTHAELYFGLFEQTERERRQLIRESEQRRLRRVV